jgi:hypothetical protein
VAGKPGPVRPVHNTYANKNTPKSAQRGAFTGKPAVGDPPTHSMAEYISHAERLRREHAAKAEALAAKGRPQDAETEAAKAPVGS